MIDASAYKALERFQKSPITFFIEVLGITSAEFYHKTALQLIADNDRVVISACHDVGKSWLLARVVLWFITCFPYSKVITTAPTYNQVKNILWSEIRAAYSRSIFPLGGKMNQTEWQVTEDGDWFAIGFSPKTELGGGEGQGTQSSFQGFHAPNVLIVFDEATGVKVDIWTMAEGMMTSANVKFVAIANPTSRASEFFRCFSKRTWSKLKLSCFDSPNLKVNGVDTIEQLSNEVNKVRSMNDEDALRHLASYIIEKPYLITLKWVVEKAIDWGMDHPLFVSKVLGQFPEDSPDTLIPLGAIESAQLRVAYPAPGERRVIGVDVARFGSDSSVFTAIHGKKFIDKKQFSKLDLVALSGAVISWARELFGDEGADVIVVDETGLGGGVVDILREAQRDDSLKRNTEVRGVQFGAGCEEPRDREKFVNLKARMFRLLSDDLKDANGLCLPDEDVYIDELPTIRYQFDTKGRMVIESKDDYKKRTGRKSPDHADSLALANFGRYDEMTVGKFTDDQTSGGFSKPFAAGLGGRKTW